MSKIANDSLARSGHTGCFTAAIRTHMATVGVKGLSRVNRCDDHDCVSSRTTVCRRLNLRRHQGQQQELRQREMQWRHRPCQPVTSLARRLPSPGTAQVA